MYGKMICSFICWLNIDIIMGERFFLVVNHMLFFPVGLVLEKRGRKKKMRKIDLFARATSTLEKYVKKKDFQAGKAGLMPSLK